MFSIWFALGYSNYFLKLWEEYQSLSRSSNYGALTYGDNNINQRIADQFQLKLCYRAVCNALSL